MNFMKNIFQIEKNDELDILEIWNISRKCKQNFIFIFKNAEYNFCRYFSRFDTI